MTNLVITGHLLLKCIIKSNEYSKTSSLLILTALTPAFWKIMWVI